MGNFEEVLKQDQKSLDINQKNSNLKSSNESDNHSEGLILMNRGILYKDQGKLKKAIQEWKNALEKLNKDSPEFLQVDEWLWTYLFNKSEDKLSLLADEALLEFEQGKTNPLDFL